MADKEASLKWGFEFDLMRTWCQWWQGDLTTRSG